MFSFEIYSTIQRMFFLKTITTLAKKEILHVEAYLTRHRDVARASDSKTLIDFRY